MTLTPEAEAALLAEHDRAAQEELASFLSFLAHPFLKRVAAYAAGRRETADAAVRAPRLDPVTTEHHRAESILSSEIEHYAYFANAYGHALTELHANLERRRREFAAQGELASLRAQAEAQTGGSARAARVHAGGGQPAGGFGF